MKKLTFSRNGITISRVTKSAAYRAYLTGKPVYIFGNNENPLSMWVNWGMITGAEKTLSAWKEWIAAWAYYQPRELGKRPYFYLEVE